MNWRWWLAFVAWQWAIGVFVYLSGRGLGLLK